MIVLGKLVLMMRQFLGDTKEQDLSKTPFLQSWIADFVIATDLTMDLETVQHLSQTMMWIVPEELVCVILAQMMSVEIPVSLMEKLLASACLILARRTIVEILMRPKVMRAVESSLLAQTRLVKTLVNLKMEPIAVVRSSPAQMTSVELPLCLLVMHSCQDTVSDLETLGSCQQAALIHYRLVDSVQVLVGLLKCWATFHCLCRIVGSAVVQ